MSAFMTSTNRRWVAIAAIALVGVGAQLSPAIAFADPNAGPQGATHGAEVRYVMDTHPTTALPAASQRLAKNMQKYWSNFARSGNPNARDLPYWPGVMPGVDIVQLLVAPTPRFDTGFSDRHKCAFWG